MYRRSKERYCSKNWGKHISISEQHVSMKIFFLELKKTLFKRERESCRESNRQNFHSCERRGHRRTAAQASPSLPPTTTSPEKKEGKKKPQRFQARASLPPFPPPPPILIKYFFYYSRSFRVNNIREFLSVALAEGGRDGDDRHVRAGQGQGAAVKGPENREGKKIRIIRPSSVLQY